MKLRISYLYIVLLICVIAMVGCGGSANRSGSVVQYNMKLLKIPLQHENTWPILCHRFGINDNGQVVGFVLSYGSVVWNSNTDDEFTYLAAPPDSSLMGTDTVFINNDGIMVAAVNINQNSVPLRALVRWNSSSDAEVIYSTDYFTGDGEYFRIIGFTETGRIICIMPSRYDDSCRILIFNEDGSSTDGTPTEGLHNFGMANHCNDYGLVVGTALVDGATKPVVIDTNARTLRVLPALPGTDPATGSAVPNDINNQGIICGYCGTGQDTRWVMWDALGNIHDLGCPTGYYGAMLVAINDDNVVTGLARKEGVGACAFVRMTDGRLINLGLFEGTANSQPLAINNLGQVAGINYPANGAGLNIPRVVVWSPSDL